MHVLMPCGPRCGPALIARHQSYIFSLVFDTRQLCLQRRSPPSGIKFVPSMVILLGRPLPDASQRQGAEEGVKRQVARGLTSSKNKALTLWARGSFRGIFLRNHKWIN